MGIIYLTENTRTGFCYIGKTAFSLEHRITGHKHHSRESSRSPYFYNAIRKYGFESFEWIVLEECDNQNLDDSERFWISYFKYIGVSLYNMTLGGEGSLGLVKSPETRERIKQSLRTLYSNRKRKGFSRPRTDENRVKISRGLLGNKNRVGIKLSDEQKRNIAQHKSKTYITSLQSPTGEVYTSITNLAEFCRQHNLLQPALYSVISGKRKRHRGWKLIEQGEKEMTQLPTLQATPETQEQLRAMQTAWKYNISEMDVNEADHIAYEAMIESGMGPIEEDLTELI